MRGFLYSVAAGLLLTAVGCVKYPPEVRAGLAGDAAELPYDTGVTGTSVLIDRWWRGFGDAQLDRLVTCALTNNLSLVQAEARLRQARALAVQAGAARQPELSLSASAAEWAQRADASGGGRSTTTWEKYGLGLAGSYEADVWGRVAAVRQVAELEARATQEDRNTVAMTVSGEVAARYFEWLAQVQTVALLESQLSTNRKLLDLLVNRYAQAQATLLDVLQQKNVLAQTEALLPNARASEQVLRQELAVLLGLPPQRELGLKALPFPPLPAVPAPGLPSELLQRRPDVRAAALRLEKAGWQVSAARADRLPAFRLTAALTYSSGQVSSLFDDWLANVAGNLAAPLLDGGRRRAEVDRVRALADERAAAYRDALVGAVFDVQAALVREGRQRETVEALGRQLEVLGQTQTESMRRYGRGLESYLAVLTAELSLQSQQRNLIQARYALLAYRVQVCRSLGGDWDAVLSEPAAGAPGKGQEANGNN